MGGSYRQIILYDHQFTQNQWANDKKAHPKARHKLQPLQTYKKQITWQQKNSQKH